MSGEHLSLASAQGGLCAALASGWRAPLERDALPAFLAAQRWFGAKDQRIESLRLVPLADLGADCALCAVDVALSEESQRYFLPLTVQAQGDAEPLAQIGAEHALMDGARIPEVAQALLEAMRAGKVLPTAHGEVRFEGTDALRRITPGRAEPLSVEQSNAAVVFGEEIILKIYRRLRRGVQPDVEMARHLSQSGDFTQTPAYLGSVTLHGAGAVTTLAAAFAYLRNEGDAWAYSTQLLGQGGLTARTGADLIRVLGRRTGDLHRALARPGDDPAFEPEPVSAADLRAWASEAQVDLNAAVSALESAALDARAEPLARRVLAARDALAQRLARVADLPASGLRTRIHGDYHLGQVLVTGIDVAIIDFEGEPRRSLAARRAKTAPLRDVAGMIRSLDYAARSVAPEGAEAWRRQAVRRYLAAYDDAMAGADVLPKPALSHALLDLFLLQKAAYEIGYELANRPGWAHLPLAGLVALIEGEDEDG